MTQSSVLWEGPYKGEKDHQWHRCVWHPWNCPSTLWTLAPSFGERDVGAKLLSLPHCTASKQKLLVTKMRKYHGCGCSSHGQDWDLVRIVPWETPIILTASQGLIAGLVWSFQVDVPGRNQKEEEKEGGEGGMEGMLSFHRLWLV